MDIKKKKKKKKKNKKNYYVTIYLYIVHFQKIMYFKLRNQANKFIQKNNKKRK